MRSLEYIFRQIISAKMTGEVTSREVSDAICRLGNAQFLTFLSEALDEYMIERLPE